MIPKKIHYCWYGNREKESMDMRCIESWKRYAPDFQIIEWNETNFPVSKLVAYAREAYEKEKFAFVTDYVRLAVLYKFGGIYMDTDVEMIKPFPSSVLINDFIGLESKTSFCTAVIGCQGGSKWIEELMELYKNRKFINGIRLDKTPNSEFLFNYIRNRKVDIYLAPEQKKKNLEELTIYPNDYFSPKNFATGRIKYSENTITVHHYNSTWKTNREMVVGRMSALVKQLIGEEKHKSLKKIFK